MRQRGTARRVLLASAMLAAAALIVWLAVESLESPSSDLPSAGGGAQEPTLVSRDGRGPPPDEASSGAAAPAAPLEEPGRELGGIVRSVSGDPMAGGLVRVVPLSPSSRQQLGTTVGVGPEGGYVVPWPDGEVALLRYERADGHLSEWVRADATPSAQDGRLELIAVQGATLEVRVVGGGGAPIPRARCEAVPGLSGLREQEADENGVARFPCLPGRVGCYAYAPDGTFGRAGHFYLGAGEHEQVTVTCGAPTARLRVVVHASADGRHAGSRVRVSASTTSPAYWQGAVVGDAAGVPFELPDEGGLQLRVFLPDGSHQDFRWPSAGAASQDGVVHLRLSGGAVLRVHVRSASGLPLAHLPLVLRRTSGAAPAFDGAGSERHAARTDLLGIARFEGLEAGPHELALRTGHVPSPLVPSRVEVAAGPLEQTVEVRDYHPVAGRVSAEGCALPSGVRVQVVAPGVRGLDRAEFPLEGGRWAFSAPVAHGTDLGVRFVADGQPLAADQVVTVGRTDHVLALREVRWPVVRLAFGTQTRLRGYLRLQATGGEARPPTVRFVDFSDVSVLLAGVPPGTYDVALFRDPRLQMPIARAPDPVRLDAEPVLVTLEAP